MALEAARQRRMAMQSHVEPEVVSVICPPTGAVNKHRRNQGLAGPRGAEEDRAQRNSQLEKQPDMEKLMKELQEFGDRALTSRDRRKMQMRRVVELGGKPQAKKSVPYNILLGMKRKQVQRKEKLDEQLQESGVVTARSKKGSGKGRKREQQSGDGGLRELQSFKGGVLYVNRRKGEGAGGPVKRRRRA